MLGQLIREIARYSLAKVDRGSNSIQVHRLIQAVIRAQMESQDERRQRDARGAPGARRRQAAGRATPTTRRTGTAYDRIWPHLGPSRAADCDEEETRQLLIDRVRYLWKRGEYDAALCLRTPA